MHWYDWNNDYEQNFFIPGQTDDSVLQQNTSVQEEDNTLQQMSDVMTKQTFQADSTVSAHRKGVLPGELIKNIFFQVD